MESSKTIFAGIVAAGILGVSAVAWAQPGGCGMDRKAMGGMGGERGPGMMRSSMKFDPAARAEQHLTRLKADLKPTAQQEPLWNAFAEKARAEAGKGMQAMRDKGQNDKLTAPERMAQMNALMKERLLAHESVTESFTRLYDSLTPEQKKAADQNVGRMGSMGPGKRPGRGMPQGPQGMSGMDDMREHRHG
ncbi:MAG: Spy/CpxP family protein refolding chaperone [Gammaproteobacteria bacterium]|nr:Spy/CpxP family protein refolding chaperone [Gammaproteobacteria bacterium]MBU1645260.1 Spy/CpxP family protein refolding chaperone [Gammaproteobacteria bacterium]MBU1971597.1 Spy/CpxP family protein refolding chaperone [Gammaproteobacteria bacterium]